MRISKRMRARRREKRREIFRATVTAFAIMIICIGIFVCVSYRADRDAINKYMPENYVAERTLSDGSVVYAPENATTGIIFYPGGNVEYTAYEPLMRALASEGILTVAVKMPLNLSVLKMSAADGIMAELPEVESWYIAGHSLGGAAAANYAYSNADKLEGVILLAAYSNKDLSDKELEVLSVYGSLDGVMNLDKYEKNKGNLPENFAETVIDGANHSGFGMYGLQKRDGEATLSAELQIEHTVDIIAEFVK